jgi:hypothetical protein
MRDLDRTSEGIESRLGYLRLSHRSDSQRIPLRSNLQHQWAPPRFMGILEIAEQSKL